MLKIENITLELERQKTGSQKMESKGVVYRENVAEHHFQAGEDTAVVSIEQKENLFFGSIKIKLKNEAFRENNNLSMGMPIRLYLEMDGLPTRMTAMYLHRDWWTRPEFIKNFAEVPERTQSLYMEWKEGKSYLLPLAGNQFKTMAGPGGERELSLGMTACQGGICEVEEPLFVLTEGATVYEAVHRAFCFAADLKGVPTKEKKTYPEMFDYLGWCSWDAFYTDISEEKVRNKAAEIKEKNIPVRWFLLDDGWLSVRENRLYDFLPEKAKFPRGFRQMIEDIKQDSPVEKIGVWHAFGGYWGGIEPGSALEAAQKEHLIETPAGKVLPHPTAEKGYGFFKDWYEILRREGIDFTKVDGQSALKNYYENQIPLCRAALGSHQALEAAAAVYMGGALINCMGMAMENILSRPGSALTRNSDDFVPDNPEGFTEHLLQNAYNALYHDELYFCDWDMFWTHHADAVKHGILRAISGGPVYISDRIGDTKPEVLSHLAYVDGKITRMDRTAKPSGDCIFRDPRKEGILKMTNIAPAGGGRKGGAIALYNISAGVQTDHVSISDIYDLEGEEFYLYNSLTGTGTIQRRSVEESGKETVSLEAGEYGLYLAVPLENYTAIIGLLDKYVSFHGVEEIFYGEETITTLLRQGGKFGFYSEREVVKITVNGTEVTGDLKKEGGIYTLCLEGNGKKLVVIELGEGRKSYV